MPYFGEVWVCGDRLIVKRYHDGCPDDPRDEEIGRQTEDEHREWLPAEEVAAMKEAA